MPPLFKPLIIKRLQRLYFLPSFSSWEFLWEPECPVSSGLTTTQPHSCLSAPWPLQLKDAAHACSRFVEIGHAHSTDGRLDGRLIALRNGVQKTTEIGGQLTG